VRNGVVEGKNCTELKWGGTSPFIVVSLRSFSGCFQNMILKTFFVVSKLITKIGDIIAKKGRVNKINSGGPELDFDR